MNILVNGLVLVVISGLFLGSHSCLRQSLSTLLQEFLEPERLFL